MSKKVGLFLIVIIIFQLTMLDVKATSLDGTSNVKCQNAHYVFRDGDSATGFVRLGSGFTVLPPTNHAANMYFDSCISVSGSIDLRSTSTLTLLADLKLDSGASFTNSGYIKSYGSRVVFGGDVIIPNDKVLHCQGQLIIDGQGHTLYLNPHAQLFLDTGSTVTLRNMTIHTTLDFPGKPAINLAAQTTKLALDNVILALGNDFNFREGQLYIHNDVAITGTSAFVYRSTMPSYIASNSSLYFDQGTTFSFSPASTNKDLFVMTDASSELVLNGCTLKTTHTGMFLTTGRLLFDNKILIDGMANNVVNSTASTSSVVSISTGVNPHSVSWSPDGRYIAVVNYTSNTLQVFCLSNGVLIQVGSNASTGTAPYTVSWSPDGKYIAVGNSGNNTLQIFSFSGSTPVQLGGNAITSSSPYSATWSPDGKYIAVGNILGALQIFSFSGGTPIQTGGNATTGNGTDGVSWSPDGKSIAVVNWSDSTLQAFAFTGGTPVQVGGNAFTGSGPCSAAWSPDNKYVAVTSSSGTFQVFLFSSNTLTLLRSVATGVSGSCSASWSSNGKYIAVVSTNSSGFAGILQIFSFLSSEITLVGGNITTGINPYMVAWSPDDKYLAVVNNGGNTLQVFTVNYQVDRSSPTLSNCITLGNSAQGAAADLDIHLLGGAQVEINGLIDHDAS